MLHYFASSFCNNCVVFIGIFRVNKIIDTPSDRRSIRAY